jgi:hypothetical protein
MSRLPHFLDNRLTDGDVVRVTRRPLLPTRKIPGTHFCWRLSRPQDHSAAGKIRSTEKFNGLIRDRTRDLPACSIVSQPTDIIFLRYFLEKYQAHVLIILTYSNHVCHVGLEVLSPVVMKSPIFRKFNAVWSVKSQPLLTTCLMLVSCLLILRP